MHASNVLEEPQVAIFPSPCPDSGGRTQVNSIMVHDGLSADFGLVEQEHVSVQFEHFRRAKAVVFDSVRGLLKSQHDFSKLRFVSPPTSPRVGTGDAAIELLSVVANCPRPSAEQRMKCFERDWHDTNLKDTIARPEQLAKVKQVFWENYEYLVAVYRSMTNVLARDSQLITKRECVAFCLSAELIDAKVTQQQIEQFIDRTCLHFYEKGDKEVGGHGKDESGSIRDRELPWDALMKRGHFMDVLFRAVLARRSDDMEQVALSLMHHYLLPYLPAPTDTLLRSHLSAGPLQQLYQLYLDALLVTFRSHAEETKFAVSEDAPVVAAVEKAPKGKKAKADAAAAAASATPTSGVAPVGGAAAASAPVVMTKEMIIAKKATTFLINQDKPLSALVIPVKTYADMLGMLGIVLTPLNRKQFMRTFGACQHVGAELHRGRAEITWPEFLEAMARVGDQLFEPQVRDLPRLLDRVQAFFTSATWTEPPPPDMTLPVPGGPQVQQPAVALALPKLAATSTKP
jgi:hypothetical protein